MRSTEIKIRWSCERKDADYGVESEDRCGKEFESIETMLEWESNVAHVICPSCGAHLAQDTDIATVIERGKGKHHEDYPIDDEPRGNDEIIDSVLFKGFGFSR